MLVSLTVQILLLAALAVIPLIFTEHLPPFQWANVVSAPPPPAHVAPTRQDASVKLSLIQPSHGFVAPSRIPTVTPRIVDEPGSVVESPALMGVPGGVGSAGSVALLVDKLIEKPPPPPAKVVAQKAAAPAEPVRVSTGVQAAKLIKRVMPVYPELAKRARISGTVRLMGIIAKDGTVEKLELVSGPPMLAQAALEAVRQWVYQPTLLNTQPVEVIAPIEVRFILNQ